MKVLGIKDGSSVSVREKRKDRRKKWKVFTGFKIGFMITEPNVISLRDIFIKNLRRRQKSRRTENVGKLSKDAPVPTLLLSGKNWSMQVFFEKSRAKLAQNGYFLK